MKRIIDWLDLGFDKLRVKPWQAWLAIIGLFMLAILLPALIGRVK